MPTGFDLHKVIEEILRDSREMVLATASQKGPWAAALVFGHDQNFNLYWISDNKARHSKEIVKNPNVAAVIDVQPTGQGKDRGLQIQGQAFELPEEEILPAAREYFAKRGTPQMPKTLEDVNDLTQGRNWYALKPKIIYVINEELFGYERKQYTP